MNKRLPLFVPSMEWAGERVFVLCGGPSLRAQRHLIPKLKGRFIAIKQTVSLRPDADIMFVASRTDDPTICAPFFDMYTGPRIVCRSRYDGFPDRTVFLRRTKAVDQLSLVPGVVAGHDTGTSAINLAWQLVGDTGEIALVGFDMSGGRWFKPSEISHPLPVPPQSHHDRHLEACSGVAADLALRGCTVWNCSPTSAAKFFPYRSLESFL